MGGAFLTSREIFTHPIWSDVIKFRLFFFIVGNAMFSDEGVEVGGINLSRGQFLRSYRNLASDLEYLDNRSLKKYSISVIKKKVDQLVKENRLRVEDTELGTLFTVVNYDTYQGFEHYKNHNRERSENSARTVRERSENNNNKDINDKNVKEDIYIIFNHWNSKKIIIHKSLNKKMESHINGRIEDHSIQDILTAIDNYNIVLKEDEYYWTHKWTLQDFMKPNNVIRFLSSSEPLKGFLDKKKQEVLKTNDHNDIRDKEIEFQHWVESGNDPSGFDWSS